MSRQLDAFLDDLVKLLQQKYNQSLEDYQRKAAGADESQFSRGANLAYYDALDLIRSQLIAFGYEPEYLHSIVPKLGKPIS